MNVLNVSDDQRTLRMFRVHKHKQLHDTETSLFHQFINNALLEFLHL